MTMLTEVASETTKAEDVANKFERLTGGTDRKEDKGNSSYEMTDLESTQKTPDNILRTKTGPKNKPALSYIALISMAIQSSEEKKMLLSEIYNWISQSFPYYQIQDKSWRNSIRHNLSLNECFIKNGRCENGKGCYWSIHFANVEDFEQGDFRRRHARCRVKKCDEEYRKLTSVLYPEMVDPPTMISSELIASTTLESPSNVSHYNGYVPMTAVTMMTDELITMFGVDAILSKEEQVSYLQKSIEPHVRMNSTNLSGISSDRPSINSSQNGPSLSQCFSLNYSYPSLILSTNSTVNL